MNWTLLGIAPTKDKKAIKAAYYARLPQVNPEDKPEEFKALRAAYEEAMRLADTEETPPVRDESPVGLWMEQVHGVYGDFPRRLDPASWRQLLAQDVCVALDSRPTVEDALLRFLAEHFYLPQQVWQVLDGTFRWTDRRAELYEHYPRDFIDYAVISGVQDPESMPLALFSPGQDAEACDQYRRLYFGTDRNDPEALAGLVQQLEALPESHPYGELLAYQLMLRTDRDRALEGCRRLADTHPGDARLQLEWAAKCMHIGDWAAAEQYARRSLTLRPDGIAPKEVLADSLAAQARYEEAKPLLFELMDAAGGEQLRISGLQRKLQAWNDAMLGLLQAQLQEDPKNDEARSKLAWCLVQNDRNEEALDLSRQFSAAYPDRYDYHNLHAAALYELHRYEDAVPHFEALLDMLRTMQPDGTKKTQDRLSTRPQKLQTLGGCLLSLGRTEQAMAPLEEALSLAPDDPAILANMGRVLAGQGQKERALKLFARLVELLPRAYHGHYLLARTLFELGRDRDAFDEVNRALDLEAGDLRAYLLKMRILLRNGVWDEMQAILTFLHEHGVTDEINTLWCEAQLMEYGQGKKDEALDRYRAIAKRLEAGEEMEEPARVWFRILVLEGEKLDARKQADRDRMLALADKSLACDPDDPACLDYKAWLLRRDGRLEEALDLYHRLEAMPRYARGARKDLADTYYQDLNRYAAEALHYYELVLAEDEQPDDHFYAGTCCRYLHRFEAGERHFLRMQEMAPEDIDGYHGLSYLYDWMGRYEETLVQIDKAIALADQMEGDRSRYHSHKIQVLRRLARPHEAAAAVDRMAQRYGGERVWPDKFDIYCQFGLWEDAKAVLRDWKAAKRLKNRLAAAEIDLLLFTGDLAGAQVLLERRTKSLNSGDAERLTLLLAELNGDEEAQMAIWEKRAQGEGLRDYELMNMAQVQCWNGHMERARDYAARALEVLEERIPRNRRSEALYRSRKSIVLAILGRMEEARAELAAVRALPLCEGCAYCGCKDADIFEANFEEIAGNWQRAWELHRAGAEKWPDDLDFVAGMRRMERKGAGQT